MGRKARLGWTAVVSCVLAAGLWLALQYGAGYAPDAAAAAAVGLSALLGGLGAAWSQLPGESSHGAALTFASSDLERVTGTFADRVDEWSKIRKLAWGARRGGSVRLVVLVHGMPGVGKSQFALYAAHRLIEEFDRYARRRGLTVLARQVKLYGTAGVSATDLGDALRKQLDPRGTDAQLARMALADLAAEWRKYLQRKLLILVLDNLGDADQVAPFLPGSSSFIVLITGRRMLQGLLASGVESFPLDVLDPAGAALMMENIVRRTLNVDDRRVIDEIARLCGFLPLAIRLAVQPLAGRQGVRLAGQLARLESHSDRLQALDEHSGWWLEGGDSVVGTFELSYSQLTDDAQLVLRRLSLAPVPVLGVSVAAALADLPRDAAAACLGELVLESLMTEDDTGTRYEIHDLLREYARSLAQGDDPAGNEAGIGRLLAYYTDTAAQVDRLLTRQPSVEAIQRPTPTVREVFPDRASTVGWAQAELPNLLACADYVVRQAKSTGRTEDHAWVVSFASVLGGILRNADLWRRSIDLQTEAAESAEILGLSIAQANGLAERGLLRRLTAELDLAAADLDRAISIYRLAGGPAARTGEAHARNTYGVILDQLGSPEEAKQQLGAALDMHRLANDPLGEANVLHDQGMAEYFAENDEKATRLIGQALEGYRMVDHPLGMAHAYSSLALVQQRVGAQNAAIRNLESARAMYRELGNGLGEITVLVRIGAMLRQSDPHRALRVLSDAVALSTNIGNHATGIDALNELGNVHLAAGDSKTAVATWSRALRLAREHGLGREEAKLALRVRHGR